MAGFYDMGSYRGTPRYNNAGIQISNFPTSSISISDFLNVSPNNNSGAGGGTPGSNPVNTATDIASIKAFWDTH